MSEDSGVSNQAQTDAGPALPLEAYGDRSRRVIVRLMWTLSAFVAAMFAIAAVAPIHRVAVAEGAVSPEGSILAVAHPEGGVVAEILNRPGDLVAAGDVILRLKPIGAEADVGQVEARGANIDLARLRLQALLSGQEPRFPADADAARVAEEEALFYAEREGARQRRMGLVSRIAQRRSDIENYHTEAQALAGQVSILEEQRRMQKSLFDEGYATRADVLDADLALAQTRARLSNAQGQLSSARLALAQSLSEQEQAQAEQKQKWSAELAALSGQQEETDLSRAKYADRVNALEVRAPAGGRIQQVYPKSAGAVVRPAEVVFDLVPTDAELIAEVRLRPEDAGEVFQGASARITLTAFDPELFGEVTGIVKSGSPTTFQAETGESYYQVMVSLSRTQLQRKGHPFAVLPGMVVRAEIKTGERSLLRHLLKPLDRALERAFQQ
jgi:HlyD family secretion protein/adhesin transport system membrane fusion protein